MRLTALWIISLFLFTTLTAAVRSGPVRPVLFEPGAERGQYLAQAPGGSLRLTPAGIEFAAEGRHVLRLALVGARHTEPFGDELLPSTTSYFLGNDSKRWRTGVANYGKVRYNGVYQGVDLVFRGSETSLEYDFLIAPNAEPSRIRMRFDGASAISVNDEGDLLVDGWFTQRRPRIYQDVAQGAHEIGGKFRIHGDHTVSFETGPYDHSRALVIDPVIKYTAYLGGLGQDIAHAIATDKAGNIYIAGATDASNFPGTAAFGQRPSNRQSGFVTKFAPIAGGKTQLLFTIYLGDNSSLSATMASGLAIDSGGNIIVVGSTDATHFPTMNAVQPHVSGALDCQVEGGSKIYCSDGFLSKFAPDGHTLIFSTYYGGILENVFNGVALDSADGIYVVGKAFGPTDLTGTATAIQPNAVTTANMQMVQFDPTGKLLYSTYLGGKTGQEGLTIAVEKPGVAWIGGSTSSSDIPTTSNAFLTTYTGLSRSAYLARIDTAQSGKAGLTYASFYNGTNGNSEISKLFLDPAGQVVFCGAAFSNLTTTPTAMQPSEPGVQQSEVSSTLVNGDAFIARIDPALSGASGLTYSSFIGGVDEEWAVSCALDPQGNFLVTGNTRSADPFLTQGSPFPFKNVGATNSVFVIRIDPATAGGRRESLLFGGDSEDQVQAMTIDAKGFAYLAGYTLSNQLPVTGGAFQKTNGGDNHIFSAAGCCGDAWVMQLDLNAYQVGVAALAPDSGDYQFGVAGAVLPAPLAVHLADVNGNQLGLPGYPVNFAGTNGAIVSPQQAVTNGDGVAGTLVKLGTASATVTATIAGTGVSYTFHANVGSETSTGSASSVSAASYKPALAAESIASAFGQDLATSAMAVTTLPLPTIFNGTIVKVKDSAGVERLAPLFYVGPTQVNYEIPAGTAAGQALVTIISGDGKISTGTITITTVAPALISAKGDGLGPAAGLAIHLKPDNSLTSEPLAILNSSKKLVASPINLGPANEKVYLQLYGTGIRGRSALANVHATIGGTTTAVTYAGAQGTFVGLDQINLGPVPRSLIGKGVVNIILTVDGQAANTIQAAVK